MKIIDDYLKQDDVDALNNLHIEYAKVHWIGANQTEHQCTDKDGAFNV